MRKKQSNLHSLHGTYRADKTKSGPGFPPVTDIRPPKWLSSSVAKAEWKRALPLLHEAGNFTKADVALLAAYCESFAGWRSALQDLKEKGQVLTVISQTRTGSTSKPVRNPALDIANVNLKNMVLTAGKLGFSPLDREKLSGPVELPFADDRDENGLPPIDDEDDANLYVPVNPQRFA